MLLVGVSDALDGAGRACRVNQGVGVTGDEVDPFIIGGDGISLLYYASASTRMRTKIKKNVPKTSP